MIYNMVSALIKCKLPAFIGPTGGDNLHPGSPGDLDSTRTHSTACSVDKYEISRNCFGAMEEGVIGSRIRHSDTCSLFKRQTFRERMHLAYQAFGLFSISTGERAPYVYTVSGSYPGYPFSDRFDHTCTVHARSIRQYWFSGIETGAYICIDGVDADGN